MITVEFVGPIARAPLEFEAADLRELAAQLLAHDGSLAAWIDKCAVAVNDELITAHDHLLHSGDRVVLLPPVCGGCGG